MKNQVQNVSTSVQNSWIGRRIIYSSDLSQQKWIIEKASLLLLLKHWYPAHPCYWIAKFLMNMCHWWWVFM